MEGDASPPDKILEPEKCTNTNCINDTDQQKLLCGSCKRRVHLRCTLLPPYQIERFLTFGKYYNTFICVNCVEVPDYLLEIDAREQKLTKDKYEEELKRSNNFKDEILSLNELIRNKETELQELKQKLHMITDTEDLTSNTSKRKQKKRKINEDKSEEDGVNEIESHTTNEEIEKLKKEKETLNERLNERETVLDETLQRLAAVNDTPTTTSNENKQLINHIEKSINDQISNMQVNLFSMIDEKIKSTWKNTEHSPSYASVTQGDKIAEDTSQGVRHHKIKPTIENFRTIMMKTKNEELAEQKDKKERACNIIMHGKEDGDNKQEDVSFVNTLLQTVGGNITPKSIIRLGRYDTNRKRPIKVILQNEENKDKIMDNLRNLKDKDEYKGISITEDYTVSEREIIKEYSDKAKEKNSLEPENTNYIWRVRGTPKNGLTLKRFMKAKPQQISKI